MKICAKCQTEKPKSEFGKSKNRKDGLHPYCKQCRSSESKKATTRKYKQQWYEANREVCIARQQKRYVEQRDEVQQYGKLHYEKNADAYKARARQWYELNKNDPEFVRKKQERDRNWRQRNRHIVAWRSLLKTSLKRLKQQKQTTTELALGYENEISISNPISYI